MARFFGTDNDDTIDGFTVSPGVVSDPVGLKGTTLFADEIYGNGGNDAINGFEGDDYIDGGSGNDTLFGDGGKDYIIGGSGDDRLVGGSGADHLDGGSGNDNMQGGPGDDTYYVDSPGDLVLEAVNDSFDTIYSVLVNHALTEGFGVDALVLQAAADANGTGNTLDNYLEGNAFKNVLSGLAGDDNLGGGGGDDRLLGGGGSDALFGGGGRDTLRGQASADHLNGGLQADVVIGGAGNDLFFFETASQSTPAQRDILRAGDGAAAFQGVGAAAGDVISLMDFDANTPTPGVDDAFTLGGRLTLVNAGSNTVVRGNTDADAAFEFELVIEDGAVLASDYTAADFFL